MKKHIFVSLISILLAATSLKAQYKSLLWEISGNGLKESSYLYGSMHVSNKLAFRLTDSFFVAIKSVDAVATEINPEYFLEGYVNSGIFDQTMALFGQNYGSSEDNFYAASFHTELLDKKQLLSAFSENSEIINQLLFRSVSGSEDYEEGTFLDLFVYQCGKKLNKSIEQLETFDQSMEMVTKAYLPDSGTTQESMFEDYGNNKNEGMDALTQIENAYRDQDLDLLDSLEDLIFPTKNMRKYLINERNKNFAKNMDSLMHLKSVFTAIGAAHLPGEMGVISLLRSMGYTVRPVYGEASGKASKEQSKLETMLSPVTNHIYTSEDSVITYSAPGQLLAVYNFMSDPFYVYADMANGAYFYFQRIPLNRSLSGNTEKEAFEMISDLIYEIIPGTILSKEEITSNNNDPGFAISTKTLKNKLVNYRIYVTPLEVLVFKTGGAENFMTTQEAGVFLESVKFKTTNTAWETFKPDYGQFEIKMPAHRIYNEKIPAHANSSTGNRILTVEAAEQDDIYFLSETWLHDITYLEEDSFELEQLGRAYYSQTDFKPIDSAFTTMDHQPAYQLTLKNDADEYMYVKVVINGPYYFLLSGIRSANNYPAAFFDSFHFTEFAYDKSFEPYTDSMMLYTVETLIADTSKKSNFFNSLMSGSLINNEKEKEDKSHLSSSKSDLYVSPVSPEAVSVTHKKEHLFFTLDSVQSYYDYYIKGDMPASLHITSSRITQLNDSIWTIGYMVNTEGSTRGLLKKVFICGRNIYTLSTVVDTLQKPSEFITGFFESFRPADTVTSLSVFTDKTNLLLEYLTGNDTTKRNIALISWPSYIDERDVPDQLITFINSPDFKKLRQEHREKILGHLYSSEQNTLPVLEKNYLENTDNSSIQISVLESLAMQNTTAATQKFLELIQKETPLAYEDYMVYSIFSPFYDSIELAKALFPALFDLTSFDEYKSPVYGLLEEMLSENAVKPSFYESELNKILMNANSELKRTNAGSEDYGNYWYAVTRFYNHEELGQWLGGGGYYMEEPSIPPLSGWIDDYGYDDYDDGYYSDYGYSNEYYTADEEDDYTGSNTLDDYSKLLVPFYSDQKVRTYFDKLISNKNDDIVFATAVLLAKNNIAVPDSIWKKFSADEYWRIPVYIVLNKYNHASQFDTAYLKAEFFRRSLLYGAEHMDEGDSILFVAKRYAETKMGSGYVYFYKSKKEDKKSWQFDCIGLLADDSTLIITDADFLSNGLKYDKLAPDDQQLDKLMLQIQLAGRKRANPSVGSNNYGYYNDWDY